MIVGFDVYHGGAGSRGGSIGAMVATIDPAFTQYYSTASIFNSREELSTKMYQDMESMFYYCNFTTIYYFMTAVA